ncbi:hypothetical protein M514_28034, partial [Trichuris suis]
MECQVDKKEHLRHALLFLYNGGLSAVAAAEKIETERPSPRRSTKWTRELAEKIGCGHVTVSRHLLSMGKKMGSWVPHQLCRDDKIRRVSAAGSLLARYRQAVAQRRPFLSQIITSDEKWCLYFNMKQTKEWLSPGKDPTP